jgi:predicted phosphodiesterase
MRRALPLVAFAVAGVLGGLLALALTPAPRADVGPGQMSLRAVVGRGSSALALPPFGEVTAATHAAPLRLELRVEQVDIDRLQRTFQARDPEAALRADVESDLEPLLRTFALRTLLAALVGGLVVGAVLPRRTPHRFALSTVSSVVAVSVLLGWTWASYDTDAFAHSRFVGPIERAPALLEAAQTQIGGLAEVRDRVAVLSEQVSHLYAAVDADAVSESTTRILHVSDIHSNPLGLEIVQQLATAFDVDAVLDTGDLTSFGSPIEARVTELIDDLDVPYLFVPGNHDSPANRAAIAATPGVELLDGDVVTVDDVRILGVPDPTFTASNEVSTEQGNDRRLAAAGSVADRVRRTRPDVLAVHDERHGSKSYGLVPVLLAGHTHERDDRTVEGTRVLTVGSTGATGIGAFTVDTGHPYEAELLRFDGHRLVAVDYVTLDGVSGDFAVDRRLVTGTSIDAPPDRPGVR